MESMKFGPQWLRNIADGGTGAGGGGLSAGSNGGGTQGSGGGTAGGYSQPSLTRYKLADHRYGREEMLGLFEQTSEVPDELRDMSVLVVKAQEPLSLTPMTEEEQALLLQNVNSTVPRSGGGGGGRGVGIPNRGGGGRGENDYGRGRGYIDRNRDEDGYGRARLKEPWDERVTRVGGFAPGPFTYDDKFEGSQGRGGQGGSVVGGGYRGSDFSRSMSTDNWRSSKAFEQSSEDGDYKRLAQGKDRWGPHGGSHNWREREGGEDPSGGSFRSSGRGRGDYGPDEHRGRGGYHVGGVGRGGLRGEFDNTGGDPDSRVGVDFKRSISLNTSGCIEEENGHDVPEWSVTDTTDLKSSVGTFDSSGAFLSSKKGDGRAGVAYRGRGSEGSARDGRNRATGQQGGGAGWDESRSGSKQQDGSPRNHSSADPTSSRLPSSNHGNGNNDVANKSTSNDKSNNVNQHDTAISSGVSKNESSRVGVAEPSALKADHLKETVANKDFLVSRSGESLSSEPLQASEAVVGVGTSGVDVATASMKWKANDALSTSVRAVESNNIGSSVTVEASGSSSTVAEGSLQGDNRSIRSVGSSVNSSIIEIVENQWYYMDPQDQVQGPFSNEEMNEWLAAGFFTMSLVVRPGPEGTFVPLGELIKSLGRHPFLPRTVAPSPVIPPIPSAIIKPSSISPALVPPVTSAADPTNQQHLLQQQLQMEQMHSLQQQQRVAAAAQQQMAAVQQQELLRRLQMQQYIQQQQLLQQQQMEQQQQQHQQQHQLLLQDSITNPHQMSVGLSGAGDLSASLRSGQASQQTLQQKPPDFFTQLLSNSSLPSVGSFTSTVSRSSPLDSGIPGLVPPVHASVASVWDIERPKGLTLEEVERMQYEQAAAMKQGGAGVGAMISGPISSHSGVQSTAAGEADTMQRQQREEFQRMQHCAEIERLELERLRLQSETREAERRETERREAERKEIERREAERIEAERRDMERRELEAREQALREDELKKHEELQIERKRKEKEEKEKKRKVEAERIAQEKREEEIRREKQRKLEETLRQKEEAARKEAEAQAKKQAEEEKLRQSRQSAWTSGAPIGSARFSQIQAEAERDLEKQRQRDESLKQMEQQRQQLAAIQQQKQHHWSAAKVPGATESKPVLSLLDIQLEEARSLGTDKPGVQQSQQKTYASKMNDGSQSVAPTSWGSQGAPATSWKQTNLAGIWDVPDLSTFQNTKSAINNNSQFPSLDSTVPSNNKKSMTTLKSKKNSASSKSKKEEAQVQQLFQATKVKDEFTQWCETAVSGIQTNVDIPTLVDFLKDIESPDEVTEYIRSYLGESKKAGDFAQQFLERRSKLRNAAKPKQQDGVCWPPSALNPLLDQRGGATASDSQQLKSGQKSQQVAAEEKPSKSCQNKKKKKMQKLDSSILGFTVHADSERIQGEIDLGSK